MKINSYGWGEIVDSCDCCERPVTYLGSLWDLLNVSLSLFTHDPSNLTIYPRPLLIFLYQLTSPCPRRSRPKVLTFLIDCPPTTHTTHSDATYAYCAVSLSLCWPLTLGDGPCLSQYALLQMMIKLSIWWATWRRICHSDVRWKWLPG